MGVHLVVAFEVPTVSASGLLASYWNAFFLNYKLSLSTVHLVFIARTTAPYKMN